MQEVHLFSIGHKKIDMREKRPLPVCRFFNYLFNEKGARWIYAYIEDYNAASQRLCEKLGMRREGRFLEFVSFVNNPDGTPLYENTWQYAI